MHATTDMFTMPMGISISSGSVSGDLDRFNCCHPYWLNREEISAVPAAA
jgi:hypothetical protein